MNGHERGQTSLDFAVGMSTFLLVFAFTLTFVPGMLQPFSASDQEATVVADRVADQLVGGMLGDPGTPYVLNTTCTVAFLNDTNQAGCRYSGENISNRAGLSRYGTDTPYRNRINVSLEGNFTDSDGIDVLCWDDANERLVERDDPNCDDGDPADPILRIGDSLPENRDSVVVARRSVSVGGRGVTLLVRVW